jgi:hypothetical protein
VAGSGGYRYGGIVEIVPERVRLMGPTGQSIFAEVEIIPRKDYPFKIRNIAATGGNFIKYELKEHCTDKQKRCLLRVENTRTEKGRYVDSILIQTDSEIRPEITLHVIGLIE